MLFQFNLYSSVLLVFFSQLMIFGFLLLYLGLKDQLLSSRLLGIFLLLSALFVFPWMVGFAGWYDNQPYRDILFYTPFIHALFFGPLIYLYVKSLLNIDYKIAYNDYLHFIPGCLFVIWALIVFVYDNLVVHHYSLMNGRNDPDFDNWYSWLWSISIVVYLILTYRYYKRYRTYIIDELSFADQASFRWLRNFLLAYLCLAVIVVVEQFVAIFHESNYVISWYYFMGFAVVGYYIAVSAYGQQGRILAKLHYVPVQEPARDVNRTVPLKTDDFEEPSNLNYELVQKWKPAVLRQLDHERIFLDPELTLTDLAKKLGTNTSLLSKVINAGFGISFNDLINNHRVEEAKRLMASPAHKHFTMLAIAFEAGFNSKATFNRAFKRFSGENPSDYQTRLQR
ncbi:AraC family transcriptional regulator [Mucilaginibacter achroorhodeus]|uniref:AraC family transcriptional regulator n=1 Tax=Mucilaginibacter achroorhodeus TaxID=2599294 RepID=A0A563UBK7_9SPHI|nr:helix-turn-helix domain-containing protein [Mucilaginibacter achroorhodeus]TWR28720.1 AraC family transcriptional regulator [Mucilaginibacter achroorhodeus]